MTIKEREALIFATRAHAAIGQKRKYTGQDYIVHPIAVAEIVKSVSHTPEMIAAALLHDVVEDCGVELGEIQENFGNEVADLVGWLTDVSALSDGNREARKALDRAHLAKSPSAVQTIKLADLIDNTKSISKCDPEFWKVYRREKLMLLEVLTKGDRTLWKRAMELCA